MSTLTQAAPKYTYPSARREAIRPSETVSEWFNPRRRLIAEQFLDHVNFRTGVYADGAFFALACDELCLDQYQIDGAIDDLYRLGCINIRVAGCGLRIDVIDADIDRLAGERGARMSDVERLTQLSTAEQLISFLKGSARFNTSTGRWMIWDGTRLVNDDKGHVARSAKRVAEDQWKYVENPPGGAPRKLAYMHAVKTESAAGISAMMKLAETEGGIPIVASDLDNDPFALNVVNGVVDLRTGRLQHRLRPELLSKLAPIAYDKSATAPRWSSFLNRIMDGNEGMIDYLQRLAGLCLSGDASVQELFIFHGGGANGKSVFIDTLIGMQGDYAGVAPDSLLTMRTTGAEHPTEIADLCGRRLVAASETEEGAKLRVQLVKKLTGDATIKARYMRQDYFEFPRTHKLILVTNNRPRINETTNAVWRRVRLIPFTVTIPTEERDPQLLVKLKSEWPGILNWCIAGFLDYQAHGMQTPEEVMIATGNYQSEQDPLAEYVAERCIVTPSLQVARNEIFADYAAWSKVAGDGHPDRNAFYEKLRRVAGVEESMVRISGRPARVFVGIGLATLSNEHRHSQESLSEV